MSNLAEKLVSMTGPAIALQELLYAFIMELIFVYAACFGLIEFESVTDFMMVEFGMIFTWGTIDGIIISFLGICD